MSVTCIGEATYRPPGAPLQPPAGYQILLSVRCPKPDLVTLAPQGRAAVLRDSEKPLSADGTPKALGFPVPAVAEGAMKWKKVGVKGS